VVDNSSPGNKDQEADTIVDVERIKIADNIEDSKHKRAMDKAERERNYHHKLLITRLAAATVLAAVLLLGAIIIVHPSEEGWATNLFAVLSGLAAGSIWKQ
jgi:hypothetical protein